MNRVSGTDRASVARAADQIRLKAATLSLKKQALTKQARNASVNPTAIRPAIDSLFFKFQCEAATSGARNHAIVVTSPAPDSAAPEPPSIPSGTLYDIMNKYSR